MDNFERLVSGISSGERQDLLKRFEKYADADDAVPASPALQDEPVVDVAAQLKTEPLFFRLWMYIKSLFSNSTPTTAYNDFLVLKSARAIAKNAPTLIDPKLGYLLEGFYAYLRELKGASEFFRETVDICEADKGRFYVFLGSLLMKGVNERIETEADPSSIPIDKEITGDLRSTLLRKLDVIFQEIPGSERDLMYGAVQGFEWLRQFTRLPLEKFESRFISIEGSGTSCPLDTVSEELAQCCRVLCNGRRISPAVLESLFLFGSQENLNDPEFDVENKTSAFVTRGIEQLSIVKTFINTVPLRSIAGVAFHSCSWVPEPPAGVEDWFIVYKSAWKKVFDQKWAAWLRERRKELARQHILKFLSVKEIPAFENKPWERLWDGFPFQRALSLGFLKGFYAEVYPSLAKTLKILMIEGDFYQRENRVEFTDAYNEYNHQAQNILLLEDKLSPKGAVGQAFEKLIKESIRTVQSKARADALMLSVESDANIMTAQFCACCRSMNSILTGVLAATRDSKYDSIANISTIQGKFNELYRQQLQTVRECIFQAYEIMKEIEAIETGK